MENKIEYIKAEVTIIKVEEDDIITASPSHCTPAFDSKICHANKPGS